MFRENKIQSEEYVKEIEMNTVADGEEREVEAAAATRKLRLPERRKVETERLESLIIVANF